MKKILLSALLLLIDILCPDIQTGAHVAIAPAIIAAIISAAGSMAEQNMRNAGKTPEGAGAGGTGTPMGMGPSSAGLALSAKNENPYSGEGPFRDLSPQRLELDKEFGQARMDNYKAVDPPSGYGGGTSGPLTPGSSGPYTANATGGTGGIAPGASGNYGNIGNYGDIANYGVASMPDSYGDVPSNVGGAGTPVDQYLGYAKMAMGLGDMVRGPRSRPPGSAGYGGRGAFTMPVSQYRRR